MNNEDKLILAISIDDIQESSLEHHERKLTDEEIELLEEKLNEERCCLIIENLNSVVGHSDLMERNKGAKDNRPYFKVSYKNDNAFLNEFKEINAFKTEADAKKFIEFQFDQPGDEWKIEIIK